MPVTLSIKPPVGNPLPFEPSPRTHTLLVVDDDDAPRESVRVVFDADYQVITAADGFRALEIIQTRKIDVAILDLRMPGMSGLELFAKLKEIDPTIEVIILTAYESVDNLRQALRLGACDYLAKPFDVATIRAAVVSAVDRHDKIVKLRNLELEVHRHEVAEEMGRTKSEIYASVLHDINAPLSSISCLADIIIHSFGSADKVEGETLEQIKERLLGVIHHANHCVEISRRYVSFWHRHQSVPEAIKVNEVLNDVRRLLKFHPDAKQRRLLFEPLAEDWMAPFNGIDFIQVLLNLILNALQCSTTGTVEVMARILTEPLALPLATSESAGRFLQAERFRNAPPLVAVTVQDHGPGIAPAMMEQIFEAYFSTKPAGAGGGLGLSIVRRCVKSNAAALKVESQVGAGTMFTLFVPALKLPAPI